MGISHLVEGLIHMTLIAGLCYQLAVSSLVFSLCFPGALNQIHTSGKMGELVIYWCQMCLHEIPKCYFCD